MAAPPIRSVERVLQSQPTLEGAGVRLRRAFGFREAPTLDPFLLLDDFGSHDPHDYQAGFPWHPHRGIETVTYVHDGTVEHEDSIGNAGSIRSGDVQWMTAGSGIIHQEMPRPDESPLKGFQLWVNLPAGHKMMVPRYRDIHHATIKEATVGEGAAVKVIAGEVAGVRGPVQDLVVDAEYLDVAVEPEMRFDHPIPAGRRAFAYVLRGDARFDPTSPGRIGNGNLVIFQDGEGISVQSGEEGVRFLLVSGTPLGEPVAWYGPVVMNSREELETAFEEYRKGTFLKHP